MEHARRECRAIIFEAPGRPVMTRSPVLVPGPEELLIEAEVSLVSTGTERSLLLHAPTYPVIPGYSLVGRVAEVGERVTEYNAGDRVVATAAHASHVVVHESFVAPLPDDVTSEQAAFFNVGAMAIHCVRLAEIAFGDPVLILGQGLIGLIVTQIARQAGAFPVIGVDIDAERVQQARALGADMSFLATDKTAIEAALKRLPGRGPAATIELTAAAGPIDMAIELTRRRGRVVAASLVPGGHKVDLYGRVFLEGLKLVGAYMNARPFRLRATEVTSPLDWPVRPYDGGVYDGSEISTSAGDVALFLRLVALGRIKLAAMLDQTVGVDQAVAMFEGLPTSSSLGCLIRWTQT